MLWFKIFCTVILGTRALASFIKNVRKDNTPTEFAGSVLAFGVDVFIILGIWIWL